MIDRILIVGYGSIGKRHLRLARQFFPNADIRLLRHKPTVEVPDLSNGCMSRIEDAITFAPQLAVIANPAPYHLTIAQSLAQIGVHLLIEKPLSNATAGVAQLLQTCKEQGNVLLTGYNLRYLPSLQRFRALLFEGLIGRFYRYVAKLGSIYPHGGQMQIIGKVYRPAARWAVVSCLSSVMKSTTCDGYLVTWIGSGPRSVVKVIWSLMSKIPPI